MLIARLFFRVLIRLSFVTFGASTGNWFFVSFFLFLRVSAGTHSKLSVREIKYRVANIFFRSRFDYA